MLVDSRGQVARRPRLRVTVDGIAVPTSIDARAVSNNYYSADWFHVTLTVEPTSGFSMEYWSSVIRPMIEVQISVGDGLPFTSLILGYADMISIDAVRRLVRVDGRDLSSLLVDSSLHEIFPSHSADTIVSLLAARHGLNPRVIPTPGLVGRTFGGEQTEIGLAYHSRATTDWDLVVRLAQQWGYDAYVSGRDFVFQPRYSGQNAAVSIDRSDVTELRLERDLTVGSLNLRAAASWNSQIQQSVLSASQVTVGDGGGQQLLLPPNLAASSMTQVAGQLIAETMKHGRSIEFGMPGETSLTARSRLQLTGTNTDFDRQYEIDSIDRMYSPVGGFRQRVRARQSMDPTVEVAASLLI